MLDTHARASIEKLLKPLQNTFLSLSPNHLTFIGLSFGFVSALTIMLEHPAAAFILLMISGIFDMLDGSVARLRGSATSSGAVLDIFSDRVVETAIIIALAAVDPAQRSFPALLMLGSVLLCITSFLVVAIFIENASEKSFCYTPGIIERSEAFGFFSAMILFPSYFLPLSYLFSLLVSLTAFIRIGQFLYGKKSV